MTPPYRAGDRIRFADPIRYRDDGAPLHEVVLEFYSIHRRVWYAHDDDGRAYALAVRDCANGVNVSHNPNPQRGDVERPR